MKSTDTARPWYREPYAWLVVGIPGVTVIWCTILYNIATSQPIGLVSDDYYNEGMGINREVYRDRHAAALDLNAQVTFGEDGDIQIRLQSEKGDRWETLSVELIHPTLEEYDRSLSADYQGNHVYHIDNKEMINGRWYLDIRDPDNRWRLKGETTLPGQRTVTLSPRREASST